jgi:hypothetical protein
MEVHMAQICRGINRGGAVTVIVSGFLLMGIVLFSGRPGSLAQDAKGGWLAPLAPEVQREAIERQLRGFDVTMAEVGYRYSELYFGAVEGNWDYALYTAEKIGVAIQNGLERRPKRRANAEAIFLKSVYPAVLEALKQKDAPLFKARFDAMRAACNACHVAEEVPFIRVGVPAHQQTPLVHR